MDVDSSTDSLDERLAALIQPATQLRERARERYEIIAEHGRGGLGRVYRARDQELGRDVALKELLRPTLGDEVRFVREALITARLEHPGVVPVHEAGRWPDGTPFYAMKLVAGRPLSELIAAARSRDQRMALLPHVVAVADTIAYAHSRQIIHRDLKPSNVIVGDFGETIVIDWGLAKELTSPDEGEPSAERSLTSSDVTLAGSVVGTPAYMAPEQARGEQVDGRADIYAIGAMLAQICTGASPLAIATGVSYANVPRDLRSVIARARAADPALRFPNARLLADELRAYQRGLPVASHRYSRRERVSRWLGRHRSIVLLGTVAAVLFAAAISWAAVQLRAERDDARHQRDLASRERTRAERDSQARLLAQARAMLSSDPSAALAALAEFPAGVQPPRELYAIAAEATSLGAARAIARAHDGIVLGAVSAADGAIVSIGRDGALRVFQPATGAARLVARGIDGPIPNLIQTRRGAVIATRATGEVVLFDLDDATAGPKTMAGHSAHIFDLDLTADEELLVSAGADRTLRVWSVRDGAPVATVHTPAAVGRVRFVGAGQLIGCDLDGVLRRWQLRPPTSAVLGDCDVSMEVGASMALSPDERWLVVGDRAHRPVVRDLVTGGKRRLAAHGAALSEVAIDVTRGIVGTASLDGAVRYSDLRTGALLEEVRHDGPAYRVLLTATGFGASAGEDALVRVIDLKSGLRSTFRGHSAGIWTLAASTGGDRLISGDHLGAIRIWDLPGVEVRGHRAHAERVTALASSPDGRLVATASRDSTVRLWNRSTDEQRAIPTPSTVGLALAFDPSGTRLAVTGGDGRIWLWTLSQPDAALIRGSGPLSEVLSWSADALHLVAGDASGAIREYDLVTAAWTEIARLDDRVTAFARDSNGRLIAGGADGSLLIDGAGRDRALIRDAHTGAIGAIHGIGAELVTGADDGLLRRWSLVNGQWEGSVLQRGAPVRTITSVDGVVAAAAADGAITVMEQGQVHELRGVHQRGVRSIALARDGSLVYSAGEDGRLVAWNHRSSAYAIMRGHAGHIRALVLLDDGGTLLSAGLDGMVRAWDTRSISRQSIPESPDAFRRWIRERAPTYEVLYDRPQPRGAQ